MTDSEPRNDYFKSIFITHISQYWEVMGKFLAAALPCGTEAEKVPHQGLFVLAAQWSHLRSFKKHCYLALTCHPGMPVYLVERVT